MADHSIKNPIRVTTSTAQMNSNQKWNRPFNAATFFNYDTTNPVYINSDFILPAAAVVGGVVYPTYLGISLNSGEMNSNDCWYNIDFRQSAGAHLVIVYTEYDNGL